MRFKVRKTKKSRRKKLSSRQLGNGTVQMGNGRKKYKFPLGPRGGGMKKCMGGQQESRGETF